MTEIIIPIKDLKNAKSRLSGMLDAQQRTDLVLAMLKDVLDTTTRLESGQVWVVSSDDLALDVATQYSAIPVKEKRSFGYNESIMRWTNRLPEGRAIAVVPGDIPMVTAAEIQNLTRPVEESTPLVRIAAAHDLEGTNGLFLSSARLICPSFGTKSFKRHCDMVAAANIELEILEAPSMANDVDIPADLARLHAVAPGGATGDFLQELHRPLLKGAA